MFEPEKLSSRASSLIGDAVEHTHAAQVATLPDYHRDPFDRLLVAQATLEDIPILSVDQASQGS